MRTLGKVRNIPIFFASEINIKNYICSNPSLRKVNLVCMGRKRNNEIQFFTAAESHLLCTFFGGKMWIVLKVSKFSCVRNDGHILICLYFSCWYSFYLLFCHHMHCTYTIKVMGIKGRRVHMIEELSETIISFQRGKPKINAWNNSSLIKLTSNILISSLFVWLSKNIS